MRLKRSYFDPIPCLALVGLLTLQSLAAFATELVYTPVNPSFGGSPLNGSVLLNAAQAQNNTKDPDAPKPNQGMQQSGHQQFNDMVERSLMMQLTSAAMSKIMSPDGKFHVGSLDTINYNVNVVDAGGGLFRVTVTDRVTGATTSMSVGPYSTSGGSALP